MRHWGYVLFLSIFCLSTAIGCGDDSDPIGGLDASGTVDVAKDASSDSTASGNDGTTAPDSALDATTSCPTGQAVCASACVDLQSSTTNCGACGTTCASGEVCSRGVCASTCGTGTTKCGAVCKDLQSDLNNCGACATKCTTGQVCSAGTCALTCSPGLVTCGGGDAGAGTCVNTRSDRFNCGACGMTCAAGSVCGNGACAVSCPGAQINCNGTCVEPITSRSNCGATTGCGVGGTGSAGTACIAGNVCANGSCQISCPGNQINCGGTCVDSNTSSTNCGATAGCGVSDAGSAGAACTSGNVCSSGACAVSCPGNQINCGGTCVDPATNRSNCGATAGCGVGGVGSAGAACTAGNVCSAGACGVSCAGSQVNCAGTCINAQTDRGYCGASGDCTGEEDGTTCAAGQVCSAGACAVSCLGSQVNCGGTCVAPLTDRAYCGATGDCAGANDGTACPTGEVCTNGACAVSCLGSQVKCNGICVDATTDRGYCGATGDCAGANDGTACPTGEVCTNGACAVSCLGSQVKCNGICVDATTDRGYCGATGDCAGANDGTACDPGQVCSGSVCQLSCAVSQVKCVGNCVDPLSNNTFCGAAGDCAGLNDGNVCPSGQVCSGGLCQVSCGGFQINCNGSCVDPRTDRTYCGASTDCLALNDGAICVSGEVCAAGACSTLCPVGQVNCSGLCIDPATDRFHCNATDGCGVTGGSAGTSCNATNRVCIASACDVACASPNIKCGSTCIDPASNPGHCGATAGCGTSGVGSAGAICTSNQACSGGSCLNVVMKVVFVTSTVVSADFGGLAAGDALCQARAGAASLPGTFKAWLSTSGVGNSAAERLTHYTGSYVLRDHTTVVANGWTDLTDGTLDHAINQTESGGVPPDGTITALCSPGTAWTGTQPDGTFPASGDCAGWTSTASTGVAGVSSYANVYWTNGCSGGICGRTAPLYCLEQ